MKQTLQWRLLVRRIRDSIGRFLAIILIIMLGVLLFVGIRSSGPDLYHAAQTYLNQQKTADLQLISTTGLTHKDVKLAQQVSGAQVEANRSLFTLTAPKQRVVEIFAVPKKLNQPHLVSGRMPRNLREIVLDAEVQGGRYQIGKTYQVATDADLKRHQFKIVGFVTSPLFADQTTRGSANIGDGSVHHFAYVQAANFKQKAYTSLALRFNSLADQNPYQDAYQDAVKTKLTRVKKQFKGRADKRQAELEQAAAEKVTAQFADAQKQAQVQAQAQLAASGLSPAVLAEQQASQAQATERKLQAAIKKAKQALPQTQYLYETRADWPGFSGYGDLTERIAAIANVFPVIFFLIAILITFTTMTRMIEEDRTQIGTFKALGYTKAEIGQSYWVYALLAAGLGTILGVIIGSQTLPRIVAYMMAQQYSYPKAAFQYDWSTILIAACLGLFATLGAVVIAINRELRQRPALLMRPRSPKAGKRILLERIRPLWRRLSFNQKVSYRNLFRFKSRMWMTILGIVGGAGLILSGFGIRDSIDASGQRQFNQIMSYQAIVTLQDGPTKKAAAKLADQAQFKAKLPVYSEMVSLQKGGTKVSDVNLYASDQPTRFTKYVHLSQSKLSAQGAILTQKVAKLLNVKAGSMLTLRDAHNRRYQVKVAAITQNYTGHFIYLTKAYLNSALSERYQPSTWLVKTQPQSQAQEARLARQLLQTDQVVNTTFISTQKRAVAKQTQMLQIIVVIFILLSGLLTFIVLYNLTNINVSERIRELSTIKVLGFYNHEVTLYIVREYIALTVVGILAGLGFGNLLTLFVIHQAETDLVIFPLTISIAGYVTAILMTIAFMLIVTLVTHFHLRHVNMIDALKANE